MMTVKLTVTGKYTAKDQKKADIATCYIGFGTITSSTRQYADDFGPLANKLDYTPDDVVFVSSQGGGTYEELTMARNICVRKACNAGAVIVADTRAHRNRTYNTGERTLERFLRLMDYRETDERQDCAVWRKTGDSRRTLRLNERKPDAGPETERLL